MKTLYQVLTQKLSENPKIKTIDLYNQKFFTAEGQTLALPAVLLEFANINWNTYKNGIQRGDINLKVHIIQELYEDFFKGANTQTRALQLFDLVEDVYLALQDFSGDSFSKLERTQTDNASEFDHLMITVLSFKTVYTDIGKAVNSRYKKIEADIEPKRVDIDT